MYFLHMHTYLHTNKKDLVWNLPHQIWVNRWIETMSSLFANPTDLLINGNISLGTDEVERQITLRQSMARAITLLKVLMESKWGKTETWRCHNYPYNTITWTTGCFYVYSLVGLEEVKIWSIKTQINFNVIWIQSLST